MTAHSGLRLHSIAARVFRGHAVCVLLGLIMLSCVACEAFAQDQAAESPRAARIHQDLKQIFSSPEFGASPDKESVTQKVGRWLTERWDDFKKWWSRTFSFGGRVSPGTAQIAMWLVLAAMIVAIAFVLAFGLRKLGWRMGANGKRQRLDVASEEIEEKLDDPDELLAAAKALAAAGQYRRAYRAIFLAILLKMDRLDLIRFDRARTNGEYLRALRSRPEVLTWMRPLTNDFDLRWYGGKSVEELDYRRVMSVYERMAAFVQSKA